LFIGCNFDKLPHGSSNIRKRYACKQISIRGIKSLGKLHRKRGVERDSVSAIRYNKVISNWSKRHPNYTFRITNVRVPIIRKLRRTSRIQVTKLRSSLGRNQTVPKEHSKKNHLFHTANKLKQFYSSFIIQN